MPAPIPDIARPMPPSHAAAAPPPPKQPPPGFLDFNWDATKASAEDAFADAPGRAQERRASEMAFAVGELAQLNGRKPSDYFIPLYEEQGGGAPLVDEDMFWRDLAAVRRTMPKALEDMGRDRAAYDASLKARFQSEDADRERRMAAGGMLGNIAGGIAGAMTDPVNLVTMPLGSGGKTFVSQVLRAGLLNGAIEAAETPVFIAEREQQGRDWTAAEMATNIGLAAGGGGAFVVAGKVLAPPVRLARDFTLSTGERLQGAVLERVWDKLPEPVQQRILRGTTIDDVTLAEIAEAAIPAQHRTEAERAALRVAQSEAGIEAGSAFEPSGGGADLNRRMLGEALARIMADAPPAAPITRAANMPAAPALTEARGLERRTALATGTVPGDAQARFMARTRRAESSGNDLAKAPTSSAFGRYQFIKGTWLAYYKRRFGTGGLTDPQILAKRSDGRLQDILMGDLTADNAAFLRRRGEAVSEGNLYLVHFAGQGGARKLFDADPNARVEDVLGGDAVAANAFLRGKTAQDVIDWAARKMGGQPVARGHGLAAREDIGDEVDLVAGIQAEIDAVTARISELDRQAGQPAGGGVGEALDGMADDADLPPPLDLPDSLPVLDDAVPEPRAFDPDAPTAEVLALLPDLRKVVDDRTRSLNDIATLARELGAGEADVRRALTTLVREGRIAMRKDNGNFMRKPPPLEGPEDVLDFIARNGGIRDDEGHALGLKRENGKTGGQRDWQRMTRRNGRLLRRQGRSIDQIGELLAEAGYLRGLESERPTVREVLDFLDQRMLDGKPRYTQEDMAAGTSLPKAEPAAADAGPWKPPADEALPVYRDWIEQEAEAVFGITRHELDPEFLDYAAQLKYDLDLPEGEAFMRAVNDYAHAVRQDMADELGEARYEDIDYEWPFDSRPGPEAGTDESWFARHEPVGPDEAAGGSGGRAAGEGEGPNGADAGIEPGPALADLPPEALTRHLDPESPATKAQAEGLEHDARAVLDPGEAVDPNLAARQRQEVDLAAAAPMRAQAEQDGTMGLALFDNADQPAFRLDIEGEQRSLKDVLDEIDGEQADFDTLRACMNPNPGGKA